MRPSSLVEEQDEPALSRDLPADMGERFRELDRAQSMRQRGRIKSNMPPGASLSPRGDLGYARQQESEMSTTKFKNSKSIRPSREMSVRNMQLPK